MWLMIIGGGFERHIVIKGETGGKPAVRCASHQRLRSKDCCLETNF